MINDLSICGLKVKTCETRKETTNEMELNKPQSSTNRDVFETVLQNLRDDLGLKFEQKDINYAYLTDKSKDSSATSSILVNFASIAKKNEVLQKTKLLHKESTNSHVSSTMRLTKRSSELAF